MSESGDWGARARRDAVERSAKRRAAALACHGEVTVVEWLDLDTNLWAEKVCFAAGRNLTEAEWTKYFPGRDYQVACPQWPAKPKT